MADPNDVQADHAVAELDRQYETALIKVGLAASLASAIRLETLGAVDGYDDTQKQIIGALKRVGPNLDKLEGTFRQWARAGQRDDGSAYGWGQWFDFGKYIAAEIQADTGASWDATPFSVVADTVVATGEDVAAGVEKAAAGVEKAAEAVDPRNWSTGVKVGIAAALIVVAALVAHRVAASIKLWLPA